MPVHRRSIAWIVVGVLVIAIAAFGSAWWSGSLGAPDSTASALANGGSPLAARGGSDREDDRDAAAGIDAERLDAEPPTVGQRTSFVVRDAEDFAVVPGAAVCFFPPRTTAQRVADEARCDREDHELVRRESGRIAIADAHGCVDVVVDPGWDVSARLGDRYGELTLTGEEVPGVPRTIWLQRDVELVVEVVDAAARPCPGVRVEIDARVVSSRRGRVAFEDTSEPTDASGRVVWRHLQRHGIAPGPDVVQSRIDVGCASDHLATAKRRVRLADLTAPVRLVVPPGGEVQLRMLDADGEPLAYAHGSLREHEHEDDVLRPAHGERERVTFTQVPLGRRWRVMVQCGEARGERQIDGPVRAGEVVMAAVEVPVRRWQVRGRILWQQQPQRAMTVWLDGVPDAFVRERERVFTDAAGAFELRGHAPLTAAAVPIVVVVRSPYDVDTYAKTTSLLRLGAVDVGELSVAPGCAADPLAIVRVLADGRDVSATAWAQIEVANGGAQQLHRTVARHGSQGIELRGVAVVGTLRLSVGAPGRRSVRRTIDAGATVTIELDADASLRTSLLLPAAGCEVYLVAERDAAGQRHNAQSEQWPWFHFIGLAPGRYCLEIEASDTVLHRTPAFELVAGPNVWPLDGSALDLRNVVRLVHAAVVDGVTGEAIDQCQWFREPPPGGEVRRAAGAPWFCPAAGLRDLLVVAEGYVPVRVPPPDTNLRLTLQPLTKVRIPWPAGAEQLFVRIAESGVRDQVLRELDGQQHDGEFRFEDPQDIEQVHAPGTVLEVSAMRGGARSQVQPVLVGAVSPQVVVVR